MSLFEKSIKSFQNNVQVALVSGGTPPVMCITDSTPFPAHPIKYTLLRKLLAQPTTQSTAQSSSNAKTNPKSLIITVTKRSDSIIRTIGNNDNIINLFPPTKTTQITAPTATAPETTATISTSTSPPQFLSTQLFTPQTLISTIHSTITSCMNNINNNNDKSTTPIPVILYIDDFISILQQFTHKTIQTLILSLLSLPLVSGLIYSLHTDSLLPLSPACPQRQGHIVDIFDALTSPATTLFQALPPPPNTSAIILSCRISHRASNGDMSSDTVALEYCSNNGLLMTSDYTKSTSLHSKTNNQQQQQQQQALPDGLKDLPFNLSVTAHQNLQRAQVELPYAHKGQQKQHGASNTRPMGLLSSAPVKHTFDEVVDDDQDEDSEL
jgi:hypothetical protein